MKRYLWAAVAFLAVGGFATSFAFARGGHGGGHGGGHHGGGHHGGGHHANGHHGQHHAHHHTHHHYAHHGAHRPFTHGWYGHHRGAWGWGYGGYGWGNPWAAATWGAAAGWLGMSALDGGSYPVENTTVYTSDSDNQTADSDTNDNDNESSDEYQQPSLSSDEAAQLAANGTNENGGQKYLPLGVYTFAPAGESEAKAMLHLAVSKDGVLRGSYLDLATDKDSQITGAVNKKTGQVAWTVGPDSKTVYQTALRDLTEQSGPVSVHEGGQTNEWTIARADETQTGASTDNQQESQPK